MITTDQLLQMDRERLCALSISDFQGVIEEHYGADDPVLCHIDRTLDCWVSPYVNAVKRAFNDQSDLTDTVKVFEREPPVIQIWTWRVLTNLGIDQIDYAKFVHRHLARSILKLFGEPVDHAQGIVRLSH